MHKAVLQTPLKNNSVQCHVCGRECVILEGKKGFCQSRVNKNGTLFTLLYGRIGSGVQYDPIEKKPMYHFHPGMIVASIGSVGCNFRCKQCLNYPTTYLYDYSKLSTVKALSPKKLLQLVVDVGVPGIAFTYNEPTIWIEYVHDCAKIAKEYGLYTVLVTNGYMTEKSLDCIGPFMDGYAVDFKGFSDQSYQLQGNNIKAQKIFELTKRALEKWKMSVEITTLLIPGINDDESELEEMVKWIKDELGFQTPWHLSQFEPTLSPDQAFSTLERTSVKTLEKAYKIGKNAGLAYVYVWAPRDGFTVSDTFCPFCQNKVISRFGWKIETVKVSADGKCFFCKNNLLITI